MSPETAEIVVIGAGPAGAAAALRAAQAGARVVLLDDQPAPGGAGWRGLTGPAPRRAALQDERPGRALLAALGESAVVHIPRATVWEIDRRRVATYSVDGQARQIAAARVILATGALERPMPFPGWTLPGVITAGAAQVLLKTAGAPPPGPIVMAGSGPLLLLVAAQLLAAGAPPAALVETTPAENLRRALPHLRPSGAVLRDLRAGLSWRRRLRRAGVALHRAATGLEAIGTDGVAALRFIANGRAQELPCATLAIHGGLAPNTQAARALGLPHDWDPVQRVWRPQVDAMGRTALEGVFIAGDGAGVAGAAAALHGGRLAALAALEGIVPVDPGEIAAERAALTRAQALRPFLARLYAPAEPFLDPADAVIVCRCEEATAGAVRRRVAEGCRDPNEIKALSRAGMGPCQGRFCALTVGEVAARAAGGDPSAFGALRQRAPLKPISLAEMASLTPSEDAAPEPADGR